jgi:hypothetical protein
MKYTIKIEISAADEADDCCSLDYRGLELEVITVKKCAYPIRCRQCVKMVKDANSSSR